MLKGVGIVKFAASC